jgi:hypothetical protein
VKPLQAAAAAIGTVALVLTPLLLLDGGQRTSGFRVAVVLLAVFALRAISTATAEANPAPPDSPFAPARPAKRRRLPWRTRTTPRRSPADALVLGAVERAGQFHHRLRPALRDAADERLRAHHGIDIDDPRAADQLGPEAWALLRADRPPPADRRSPGPDAATMDRVLTAIERL